MENNERINDLVDIIIELTQLCVQSARHISSQQQQINELQSQVGILNLAGRRYSKLPEPEFIGKLVTTC